LSNQRKIGTPRGKAKGLVATVSLSGVQ